jgi:diadenosine tetraphosphate (Ap4A) HIT family hydrolase
MAFDTIANKADGETCPLYDTHNSRCEEQSARMKQAEAEGKDLFDPEVIAQPILFKTDYWYVTQNDFPYWGTKHHFLIISLLPVYDLGDMSPEMWEDLRQIWQRLIDENHIQGGALSFRFGNSSHSGATIKRLHVHLIEPDDGQKVKFSIGGKGRLGVPAGARNTKQKE